MQSDSTAGKSSAPRGVSRRCPFKSTEFSPRGKFSKALLLFNHFSFHSSVVPQPTRFKRCFNYVSLYTHLSFLTPDLVLIPTFPLCRKSFSHRHILTSPISSFTPALSLFPKGNYSTSTAENKTASLNSPDAFN